MIRAKRYTPVFVLVGNKADLFETERKVTEEEGRRLAQKLGCKHFEVSALWGVNKLFTYLVQSMRCSVDEIEDVEKTRERKKRRVKLPCLIG
jgi:hypothetical protein